LIRKVHIASAFLIFVTFVFPQDQDQKTADPTNTIFPSLTCKHEKIFRAGQNGVTIPKVLSAPNPAYTQAARDKKTQGSVAIAFVVGSDGQTCNIKVHKHLAPDLDKAAIDAVSSWRFAPATLNDTPVAVNLETNVDFKLLK